MTSQRPTLRDVARLSGVSEISVSRVMRGAPNISDALRARVEAAAGELGYTPNRLAGGLKARTSDLIAVVVPSMSNGVFPEVVDGIDAGLAGSGHRTVLGITRYDADKEAGILRDLLSWAPAGVIVAGLEHTAPARRLLEGARVPVVEIMDIDGVPVDRAIGVSHRGAAEAMADHLVARGYGRIGYVGAWAERPSRSAKRRLAFEARLAAHDRPLVARRIEEAASSIPLGRRALAALLADHPDLDAVFFANDDLAVGGLMHCVDAGLAVPDGLALAGFNGLEWLAAMPLRLTTIRTPRYEMGLAAARALTGSAAGCAVCDLGFELVVGDTT
ncbi:MAG: LacI family DNA-binding transcriptional regulator [Alkalilacustris sp.]